MLLKVLNNESLSSKLGYMGQLIAENPPRSLSKMLLEGLLIQLAYLVLLGVSGVFLPVLLL
jgi:hypothetical protein